METPIHIDILMAQILAMFPNFTFEEDKDGQLIIYTGLYPVWGDTAHYTDHITRIENGLVKL